MAELVKDTEKKQLEPRMVLIENDGEFFFIYFDGTTYYDEDHYGKPIERENHVYLDNDFHAWYQNVETKADAKEMVKVLAEKGVKAFAGPRSPETEEIKEVKLENGKMIMQEVMVPNTRKEYGVWLETSEEQKDIYRALLTKQQEQNKSVKMVMSMTMPKSVQ